MVEPPVTAALQAVQFDACADYLQKYAPYLHYDRYLAAGYPIATGVIEGACRYLVRDRMELTGARWRLVGAEAVLKLRALRASGDFDAYWISTRRANTSGTTPSDTLMGQRRRSASRPRRPLHHAFDASSSSCRDARRSSLGRRRRRATPNRSTNTLSQWRRSAASSAKSPSLCPGRSRTAARSISQNSSETDREDVSERVLEGLQRGIGDGLPRVEFDNRGLQEIVGEQSTVERLHHSTKRSLRALARRAGGKGPLPP